MIALHEKYVLVVSLVNYLLTVYLRLHFSFKICFPPSRTPSFSSVTNSNCVDLPACFFPEDESLDAILFIIYKTNGQYYRYVYYPV